MNWFKNLRWRSKGSNIKLRKNYFISEARKDYFDGYYITLGEYFSQFNDFFNISSRKDFIYCEDYVFVSKKMPQIGAIVHFTPHIGLSYAWTIIKRIRELRFVIRIPYILITERYDSGIDEIISKAGGIFFSFSNYDTPKRAFINFNKKLRDFWENTLKY